MHRIFDDRAVNAGGLTLQQIREEFQTATLGMRTQLDQLTQGGAGAGAGGQPAVVNQHQFQWHLWGGSLHMLPQEWQFPSCTALQLWQQWLIGDTVTGVLPLQRISHHAVAHLDLAPLPAGTGRRRAARKTLCDIRYLMRYIRSKVQEAGQYTNVHTIDSANAMFNAVATIENGLIIPNTGHHVRRDVHIKWPTVLRAVRKALKAQRDGQQQPPEQAAPLYMMGGIDV